jgi:hypothetical protein
MTNPEDQTRAHRCCPYCGCHPCRCPEEQPDVDPDDDDDGGEKD